MEKGVVCKVSLVVPPEKLRKYVLKSVYNDVHCGITATHKWLKLEAWWLGDTWEFWNVQNVWELRIFNKRNCTSGLKKQS